MYLKSIFLENTGPIDQLDVTLPFTEEGNPKPVIFVGENGTGKSLVLAYIVNCLISIKQQFYDDIEVKKGQVYKIRSSGYIKNGNNYYYSKLGFENDIKFVEWQLNQTKDKFEETYKYCPLHQEWSQIPEYEHSFIVDPSMNKQYYYHLKKLFDNNTICFFPPNRFEEPAWLNIDSLQATAQFSDIHVNTKTLYSICKLLEYLFDGNNNIKIYYGNKHNRTIGVVANDILITPNLFYLSTGESILFTLFCSILRDYDLTRQPFTSTEDIRGIVIIDEIDLHLHTKLQRNVLKNF